MESYNLYPKYETLLTSSEEKEKLATIRNFVNRGKPIAAIVGL